jgi:hypothetical protein
MAYKNKKKNRRHVRSLRVKEGTIRKKHAREKDRNHPNKEPIFETFEKLMKQQGLI